MSETARNNFASYKDKEGKEDKEGYYIGRVYYAANKPKSKEDNVTFDRDAYNLVRKAMDQKADKKLVGEAMQYLSKIGYYDGDVDSLKGKMFMGAAQRLITNKADDAFLDEAREWDFMKWIRGESK